MGTCLDLALLFCGAALGASLLPLVILTDHHAVAAVSLDYNVEDWSDSIPDLGHPRSGVLDQEGWQPLLLMERQGKLLFVECTGFAEAAASDVPDWENRVDGRLTFEQAIAAGRERLKSDRLVSAVNVAVQQKRFGCKPESLAFSPVRRPRQIPVPGPYISRHALEEEVERRLFAPECRVLTIRGMSGSGKSTLAGEVARRIESRFEDGVLWVTLTQNAEPLPLLASWLEALGESLSTADPRAASAYLRTSLQDKQMLLVADDVWQLSDAELFHVGGDRCKLLITTRTFAVASLGEVYELPSAFIEEEAMRLFALKLHRALQPEEEPQARRLAKRSGYLPLALELGAAQIANGMEWADLTAALEAEQSDLGVLELAGSSEELETARKRLSVRASFELSLRLLSSSERVDFAWIGILAPGAPILPTTLAAVWGLDERGARLRLARFTQLSLLSLSTVSGAAPSAASNDAIWRIHALLGDFARPLLARADGRGLTLAQAHGEFLNRHRPATGDWTEAKFDRYLSTQLSWHLEQAGRGDELEALLLRETASKTNAWYTWRDELGQTVEYLVDLERAARLARAQPDSLHGQIQLAAMRASVQSVTEIVPWELLAALLNQKIWNVRRVLNSVRQIRDPEPRLAALLGIASRIEPPEIMDVGREILAFSDDPHARSQGLRSRALQQIGRNWPESLVREALTSARSLVPAERDPVFAAAAIRIALLGYEEEALGLVNEIADDSIAEYVLRNVASSLSAKWLTEAERLAHSRAKGPSGGESAIAAIAGRLAQTGSAPEAIARIGDLHDDQWRGHAIEIAAPFLDTVRPAALELAKAIENPHYRAPALAALLGRAGEVGPEQLEQIMNAAEDSDDPGKTWRIAVSYLPPSTFEELQFAAGWVDAGDRIPPAIARRWAELGEHAKAVAIVQGLENSPLKLDVLVSMLETLPEPLMPEVRREIEAFPDPHDQSIGLAAFCSRLARLGRTKQAVELAQQIPDREFSHRASRSLLPFLEAGELREMLAPLRRVDSGSAFAQTMAGFFPYLPMDQQLDALDWIWLYQGSDFRGWQTVEPYLLPAHTPSIKFHLKPASKGLRLSVRMLMGQALTDIEMLSTLLEAAPYNWDARQVRWATEKLLKLSVRCSPYPREIIHAGVRRNAWHLADFGEQSFLAMLPVLAGVEEQPRLLDAVRNLESAAHRALAYAELALAWEESRESMIEAARREMAPMDAVSRIRALAKVSPFLSKLELREAAGVCSGRQGYSAETAQFAERLAQLGDWQYAQGIAEAILEPVPKSRALAAISLYAPAEFRGGLMVHAIRALFPVPHDELAAAVKSPAVGFSALPDADAMQCWDELSRLAIGLTRPELLEFLASLAPLFVKLGGQPVIARIAEVLRETAKWWP
jgi:ABC-type cobalamin/Fe3+-siderophores transport system ATPase subunit